MTEEQVNIKIKTSADDAKKSLNSLSSTVKGLQSAVNLINFSGLIIGARRLGTEIYSLFKSSADYIETLNLFRVQMGASADKANEFANSLQSIVGVDIASTMKYMSGFMTLSQGFGATNDEAYKLSKNLTQLTYDMASLHNLNYDTAYQKIISGFSGEQRAIKILGVAVDQNTLKETASRLGIEQKVSSMNKLQRSELIYYQLLKSTTGAQGDLARTLVTPANAVRILQQQFTQLGRAIGNIFIPIAMQIIPVVQAIIELLTELANSLASMAGFNLSDYASDLSDVGTLLQDTSDDIGGIGDSASDTTKKLNKMLMPFDELNNISLENASQSDGSATAGGSLGIDLPEYNMLANVGDSMRKQIDQVKDNIKSLLPIIGTVAAGMATLFAIKKIADFVKYVSLLKTALENLGLTFTAGTFFVGVIGFIQDLKKLGDYINDFSKNGASFQNVSGMIAEFAGVVGDALIILGGTKYAAAFKAIQGIGEIAGAIYDISQIGINFNNVTRLIEGISSIGIAAGLMTKNWRLTGVSLALKSLTDIIEQLQKNWDAIKKGDLSGVDKVRVVIDAIGVITGIAMAFGAFSKIKVAGDAVSKVAEVSKATETVSTGTSKISSGLVSLAKNLGMGLVVIAEVSAAALLFVGAIWLLGEELQKVAEAWTPVIENGQITLEALGLGTALLLGIGIVTGLLGTAGTSLIISLGLGIAVLTEIGIAAGLFIVEIWAVGEGLNLIGEAWAPVIENGEFITNAIAIGTGFLIAIAGVTALLGVATVATGGTLPLAIGAGTAMLVLISGATILFIDSLADVANELTVQLYPKLQSLNDKMPGLNSSLNNFIDFMSIFANLSLKYSRDSAIAGFSGVVDKIIKFFTGDPIENLANQVEKTAIGSEDLINKLKRANIDLATAIVLFSHYSDFLQVLQQITGRSSGINLSNNIYVNMYDTGRNLVIGFANGINAEYWRYEDAINRILNNSSFSIWNAQRLGYDFGWNFANAIARAIRETRFPTLRGNITTSGDTASFKFNAYASGGFPKTGELFYANEAGPEIIGQIGNRTAVANKDQITEGIESATYNAMNRALQQNQRQDNTNPIFKVYVGNDKLYDGYGEYQDNQSNMYGVKI